VAFKGKRGCLPLHTATTTKPYLKAFQFLIHRETLGKEPKARAPKIGASRFSTGKSAQKKAQTG